MITPAVLISASGTLVLSTANRLSRVMDRMRRLSVEFEELAKAQTGGALLDEERAVLFNQLGRSVRRSRLLHRALASLYMAIGSLVATSIVLGLVALSGREYAWVPLGFGIVGAGLLFYASTLLIAETRVAHDAIEDELAWVLRLSQHIAPKELLAQRSERRRLFQWEEFRRRP